MEEVSTSVLILHGLIGFFGVVALVLFFAGLTVYVTRLGTERRELGIDIMIWGLGVMIMVILLIGVLRYLQS